MAEALAVIGLVSAIVQFVDFSSKVVRRLNEFDSFLGEVPKTFRHIKTELPLIIDALRRTKDQAQSDQLDKSTVEALLPVIEACQADVSSLNEILNKAIPLPGVPSWGRRKKAISSLGTDRKVDSIAESLGKYVRVLTLHQAIEGSRTTLPPSKPLFFTLIHSDRNSNFVGRENIFSQINEAFHVKQGSQPRAALCGLGGIGKSQIALEFCFRRRENLQECSIFWVNAATVARFEESYKRIATGCKLLSPESGQVDVIDLVKNWLESQHDGPWLMVVDNVDDAKVFFREQTQDGKTIQQCIPQSPRGALLFTTRNRDLAVDLARPSEPITVPTMNSEEGRLLLDGRLNSQYTDKEASELLEELEYIPLAITQAAAFMTKRRFTIPRYLELYRKSDSNRTRLLVHEFSDHGRQLNSLESVAKTWTISFESIREEIPRAASILSLMSFLDRQAIPVELLQNEDEDSFEFEDSVAILQAFSLVESDGAAACFDMHRLVQLATRWWLAEEKRGEEEKWAFEALKLLASRFPPPDSLNDKTYSDTCARLLPHAELTLRYNFKAVEERTELARAMVLHRTSRYIHWRGFYQDARTRVEKAFQIRQKYLGERHPETLRSLGLLFWTYLLDGEGAYQLDMGRRLLNLREEVLGKDDPETIDCLSDLARALELHGDLEESEAMQIEALEASKRVLGPENPNTLNCMAHLASVLDELERWEEGENLHREECRLTEKVLGPESSVTLIARHNLAVNLREQDKLDEAEAIYTQVLNLKEKVFGLDHPETLVTLVNLISLLHARGLTWEDEEFIELRRRVLQGLKPPIRPDNRLLMRVVRGVGIDASVDMRFKS